MPIKTGGVINYDQKFADVAENFDVFIAERYRAHPTVWVDRIPKGTLSNYEGITRKSNIFHGGLGEQAGLSNWSAIQVSRVPAGTDQGFDACQPADPKTFTYAIESIQYTGKRCSWQGEPICINDIRFVAEAKQQCAMVTNMLSYITQSVWENWNREQYVKQAVDAGHAFILTDGGLDYASDSAVRFTYDGSLEDTDGDTYLTFPLTYKLSTLNWSFFDWWQDMLGDQCPEAAISNLDGLPVFGLMIHKRDFNKMVMGDADLREDYRYADSRVLIADYRTFKEFKGWALIHDSRQMRFKFKKCDGTTVTCKRVTPLKNGKAVTIGNLPIANEDYQNAEIAVGVVFMKDIVQNLIPTPISNMPNGMQFGAVPGYDGKFMWINEYDRVLNPLREVGYFFARFEAFPKPLMYSGEAVVFIYLRAPQTWSTEAAIENFDSAATTATVAVAAVTGDLDSTNNMLTLKLDKILAASVGDTVTMVDSDVASETAYIADASLAPVYTFVSASAFTTYDKWNTTATVTVA
jgi:hypothetical protein